jgi:hypothetical protein
MEQKTAAKILDAAQNLRDAAQMLWDVCAALDCVAQQEAAPDGKV